MGPCQVIEISSSVDIIQIEHLQNKVDKNWKRLLVKTGNSQIIKDEKFHENYTAFSPEAAAWLVENNIKLLGLDYYSIGPFTNTKEVHLTFLENDDTAALEAVDLSDIAPGKYQLVALPLKLEGASGAPTRVLLGEK